MSAAGVSLDKAIAGIARGVENATRTLKDINPDGAKQMETKPATGTDANRTIGGNIDVSA